MPTTLAEATPAPQVLRLLLNDLDVNPVDLDWTAIRALAERNRILVRVAAAVTQRGKKVPERFAAAATRARERAEGIVSLLARIGASCERHGIVHAFLKTVQHYPDVGGDVDILVSSASPDADTVMLRHVPALPRWRHLANRVAGTVAYAVPEWTTVIDVHHGRLGRLGEHTRYADLLLRRRRLVRLGAASCYVPSQEDQLLLQALSHASGRSVLRLGDVSWTIAAVRAEALDWDAIGAIAQATGLLPGLGGYLDSIEQIHREVFGYALLKAVMRERLVQRRSGKVEFRRGSYRVPTARVSGESYVEQLRTGLTTGDWAAAGRIFLLPVVAMSAIWRRFATWIWR